MKKLYIFMIIIFSLFIISDVNAGTDIRQPIVSYGYDLNTTTQLSISSYVSSGTSWWRASGGLSNTTKIIWVYNLTDITEDYITFTYRTYYAQSGQPVLDGTACSVVNQEMDLGGSSGASYVYSIICTNPRRTEGSTLEFYFNQNNPSSPVMDMVQRIGYYSDFTSASINLQTQQQAIQHQEIVNDDTSGNANDFNSDINNFSVPNDSHAFDILGSLQSFVGNIQVSGSCTRVSVPIPFTDKSFTLPCMTTDVYSVHFRELVIIWQLICRGVGYYYILVNVLKLVKETLDPFNFKLEVLDL